MRCRLGNLGIAVQAGVAVGSLATRLGALVGRTRDGVDRAEAATTPRPRKRALGAAADTIRNELKE